MDDLFLIFANQRTGHHGFMNWIIPQYKGRVRFINCCRLVEDKKHFEQIHHHDQKSYDNGPGKYAEIINFENINLNQLRTEDILTYKKCKSAKNVHLIGFIRDPYNWLSSIVRGKENERQTQVPDKYFNWIIKNYQSYMDAIDNPIPGLELIMYHEWFTSKNCRREISEQLGLEFSDVGLNAMTPHGLGSSFDKMKFNNRAQNMKVLTRYKEMNGRPSFDKNKHKLIEIAKKYFPGFYPDDFLAQMEN